MSTKDIVKAKYLVDPRKYAVSVLASLSDEKMMEFIALFADENTLARLECEMLENDPASKRYSSFDEILEEVEAEMREEDGEV